MLTEAALVAGQPAASLLGPVEGHVPE